MLIASALAALFLALIHFFANLLRFSSIPRSKWLSIAGGISVSYVFIHLLPDLEEWQNLFEEKYPYRFSYLKHHLYLVALLGLTIFYGMEKAAIISKASQRQSRQGKEGRNQMMFWIHIVTFAIYNALIGYLLIHRENETIAELIWFTVAMGFHFIGNDYSLLDHYRDSYQKQGRWVVTLAVLMGWLAGVLTNVSEVFIAVLFALVAGSIVLNVLKEELPEERKSNFWAFCSGILIYTSTLLIS